MSMITLTRREQQWKDRARQAVEAGESWEECAECLRYHPQGYEGPCDDLDNRLPARPADLVA